MIFSASNFPCVARASLGAAGDHWRSSPADQRRVAQGAVPPPLDERQATAGVLRQRQEGEAHGEKILS